MCYRPLCYGDSNTYGYNPRSYLGGRYPESVRWTAVLNTKGWEVINKGDNGHSIPKLNQEIGASANVIHRSKAETVVVMLGSNDLL